MDVKWRIIYYVFKQQKSRGAGSPRGVLRDVPLVLMTCVVHYGVTRDWRRRGGLWEGLSPSATEGGPPLWDCQRWGLLEESSCPKTHTHIRFQVPSQDTKQMVTSYICFTQPRRNRTKMPNWSWIWQTGNLLRIPRQMLRVQYWPPALHPKRVFRLPTGMLHKNTICYLQRNICKWRMNRLAIRSMSDPSAALPFRDRNMNQELD